MLEVENTRCVVWICRIVSIWLAVMLWNMQRLDFWTIFSKMANFCLLQIQQNVSRFWATQNFTFDDTSRFWNSWKLCKACR